MSEKQEEIVVAQDSGALTKMNDFTTVQEALDYASWLIKSKLINFKKPEEALMAFNMGKAIGLDPAVAATNLYVVNNRITFSVHLAAALAKRAGIEWEIVKDGEYQFEEDGKTQRPPFVITQIRFLRYSEKIKRVITNEFTYTWQDAQQAGYTTKDNWTRMPKNMLRARCLMEGIRFVAPDVLSGVFYEATEMVDANNLRTDIMLDDDGNPVLKAQVVS